MNQARTHLEISSWREGATFEVPLNVPARLVRWLGGKTSAASRGCFQLWIEMTLAKAPRFQFANAVFRLAPKRTLALLAFAWFMGGALLAEDSMSAPGHSNTNAPVPLTTNKVAVARTNTPARSAINVTNRLDYASFKVIADRSIFDPNRSRRSGRGGSGGPERKAVKVESFTLVGTMSYDKGDLAFFDGSESQYRKAFKPQSTIAGYKLTAIAANSVKLEKDGKTVEMFIGAQMKKRDDEPWEMVASSLSLFSTYKPKAGASADTSASDDEVLKRLLERRKKEAE